VNGVETRAFIYDSTTAAYTLKLPVGVSYDILPSVKNFYNKYEQVDLTKTKKGTKVPKNFYITPIEVGQAVNIDFIYFETGKSTLKPQSFRSLNALVDFLNEYPNVIVEIGGHTDNTGSAAINEKISNLRAKAVADYVVSMGIPASRITSKGYSFNKPKASNATATGRAQNRRVEFTIVGI
jgi:Outer membrane protein and related peptidoglycan-associated (lipo)proteins